MMGEDDARIAASSKMRKEQRVLENRGEWKKKCKPKRLGHRKEQSDSQNKGWGRTAPASPRAQGEETEENARAGTRGFRNGVRRKKP
jgi:hypothetical protein